MKRTVVWEKRALLSSEGGLCVQNYSGRRGMGTRTSRKRRGGGGKGTACLEEADNKLCREPPRHTVCNQEASV